MKIVVSAWIGSNNLGDELIFHALLSRLEALGIQRKDVTAITLDVTRTRRQFGTAAVGHLDFVGQLAAIYRADLLLFGGGGLLQDETSIWNLPYHLSRVWMARLSGKRVFALGLGAGRITTRLGGWLVRLTFGRKIPISVRDEDSRQLLSGLGLPQAQAHADLVLSLPTVRHEPMGYIAVALRPFVQRKSLLPVGMRKKQGDPKDPRHIAAALDQVSQKTGLPIRFVSFDLDKDLAYQQSLAALMSTEVRFVEPTVGNVTDVIGKANAVIGMRYHAGIVAVLGGVPSVLIGYSPKVNSLAEEVGDGCRVIANDSESFARIPELLAEVIPQRGNVAEARERLHRKALEGFDLLPK